MFSWFLKFIIPPFTFRVYFRRIFYSNLHKVPLDKPLLFSGNHQNSFMDGVLVGSYLPQPINFLMRADMFRNKFASFCLRQLNVSPVYRAEEGLENVHKNIDTFQDIYNVLRKNGNYIVFSEGICVQEKRLQKLRKGTARMAFGAAEEYGLDVHIVPVGINYTYPTRFRKEVMINFHEPFSIKELQEIYRKNPAKALLEFNQKVESGLDKEVIIVEKPENDKLAERLLVMVRNDNVMPFFKWRFDSDERRLKEKKVADAINLWDKNDKQSIFELESKTTKYFTLLKINGLRDENIARKLDRGLLRYLSLVPGLPVYLAGIISNLIPYLVPHITCKFLINDKRFLSSVYIGVGTVFYLIYFSAIVIVAIIALGWIGLLPALLVPLTGYLSLFYREVLNERFHTLHYSFKKATNPGLISDLSEQRKAIMSYLDISSNNSGK
jgi:glycerol-3-phosphate O-acyltransferase/dihydroxyacetone phosphate acyltransferase